MTSPIRPAAFLASLLTVAALLLTGCASLGIQRKEPPSASLQSAVDDYQQAQLQTAATEDALNKLFVADFDLKESFAEFSANADRMERIGKRLAKHAAGMHWRGTDYFVEPGTPPKSCVYPPRGKSSGQQSVDLGENFTAVSEAGAKIERAYLAYHFDIEQIHDALACRLTPANIEAADQIQRKAAVDSENLQEVLQKALDAMQRAKATMPAPAPTGVAPPGTPPVDERR